MTWWESPFHQSKAGEYNLKWDVFIRENQGATKEQILEKGIEIMIKYGIEVNY